MWSIFHYDPIPYDEGSLSARGGRQEKRLQNILRNENILMIKYLFSKIKRSIVARVDNYKFYWSLYYLGISLLCGAIIAIIDQLSYLDGLFIAASAMTGSGLATIPMYQLSRYSFGIMAILIMIGCAPFMILPPIYFRRKHFHQMKQSIEKQRSSGLIPSYHSLTNPEQRKIKEYDQIYDALGILLMIGCIYYIIILLSGVFITYGALYLKPLPQELIQRHMNYFDCGAFFLILNLI